MATDSKEAKELLSGVPSRSGGARDEELEDLRARVARLEKQLALNKKDSITGSTAEPTAADAARPSSQSNSTVSRILRDLEYDRDALLWAVDPKSAELLVRIRREFRTPRPPRPPPPEGCWSSLKRFFKKIWEDRVRYSLYRQPEKKGANRSE